MGKNNRSKSSFVKERKIGMKSDLPKRENNLKVIGLKESFLEFDVIVNDKEKRVIEKREKAKVKEIKRTDFETLNKIDFQTRNEEGFFDLEGIEGKGEVRKEKEKIVEKDEEEEIDFLNF